METGRLWQSLAVLCVSGESSRTQCWATEGSNTQKSEAGHAYISNEGLIDWLNIFLCCCLTLFFFFYHQKSQTPLVAKPLHRKRPTLLEPWLQAVARDSATKSQVCNWPPPFERSGCFQMRARTTFPSACLVHPSMLYIKGKRPRR